jgi:hypothetical protein
MFDRFWAGVDRSGGDDSCWLWQRGKSTAGYGVSWHIDKVWYTHRLSYEIAYGPIPPGLMVLHSCDTPACCNPAHLRTGTQADNMRDRQERGRTPSGDRHRSVLYPESVLRGEQIWNAKLTAQDVRDIRRQHRDGKPQAAIARHYGMSNMAIHDIVRGRNWRHVEVDA